MLGVPFPVLFGGRRRRRPPVPFTPAALAPALWLEAVAGRLYQRDASGGADSWGGDGAGNTVLTLPDPHGLDVGSVVLITNASAGENDATPGPTGLFTVTAVEGVTFTVEYDSGMDFAAPGSGLAGDWRDATPAGNGDPVGLWLDYRDTIAAITHPHLSQTTGGARPTALSTGGRLWVDFAGVDEWLFCTSLAAPFTGAAFWATGASHVKTTSLINARILGGAADLTTDDYGSAAALAACLDLLGSGGAIGGYANLSARASVDARAADTDFVWESRWTGGVHGMRLGLGAEGTAAYTPNLNVGALWVGSHRGMDSHLKGRVQSLLVRATVPADADRDAAVRYLAERAGVSV